MTKGRNVQIVQSKALEEDMCKYLEDSLQNAEEFKIQIIFNPFFGRYPLTSL